MKKRRLRKIVKRYADKLWVLISDTGSSCSYAWIQPGKWNTKEVKDEFYRQKKHGDLYFYKIWI